MFPTIPVDYLTPNQFDYSELVPIVISLEIKQPDAVLSDTGAIRDLIVAKAEDNGIDSGLMLKIAQCESGLKQDAIHHNINGTIDIGILQLNDIHGLSVEDRLDPEKNIDYGIKLFKRNGTKDWSASRACWQS